MTQAMTDALFVCAVEQNVLVLCEKHAKAFELAAMTANTPHTIIELEQDEIEGHKCYACDLQDEMTRPRIVLPGEFL